MQGRTAESSTKTWHARGCSVSRSMGVWKNDGQHKHQVVGRHSGSYTCSVIDRTVNGTSLRVSGKQGELHNIHTIYIPGTRYKVSTPLAVKSENRSTGHYLKKVLSRQKEAITCFSDGCLNKVFHHRKRPKNSKQSTFISK